MEPPELAGWRGGNDAILDDESKILSIPKLHSA